MATIFISYRRADSASETGRIYDHLRERYGKGHVFKDVDSIPPGARFPDYIRESIEASDVALVVIGPRWLNASAGFGRRRLDDPADFVRLEIETALRLGVAVIPVLVGGAKLPPARRLPESLRPLLLQNGLAVRQDPDFARDIERVYAAIDYWQGQPRRPAPAAPIPAPTPPAPPAPASEPPAPSELVETAAPSEPFMAAPSATAPAPEATSTPVIPPKGKRWRAVTRTPGMLAASALLVGVVAVVAILSNAHGGWLGSSSESVQQTRVAGTAAAFAALGRATETQNARVAAAVYKPAAIGPCDPAKLYHYDASSEASPSYWEISSSKVVTCESDGKSARLVSQPGQSTVGQLTFWGLPENYQATNTGFPANFTITMNIAFTSTHDEYNAYENRDYYCVDLMLQPLYYPGAVTPGWPPTAEVCRDGSWSASLGADAKTHRSPLIKAPLTFTIVVKDGKLTVRAKSVTMLSAEPLGGSGYARELDISLSSQTVQEDITISKFVLTPMPS